MFRSRREKRESLKKRMRNCVAQTGSLLFRRLAAGGVQSMPALGIFGMSSQRRRPRIANSRHRRLPVCATTLICLLHKGGSPAHLFIRFCSTCWADLSQSVCDLRATLGFQWFDCSFQGHVLRYSPFTRKTSVCKSSVLLHKWMRRTAPFMTHSCA